MILKVGDVVGFSEKAKSFAIVREGFDQEAPAISYIAIDKENHTITRQAEPSREEIPVQCNEQLVVEWYSK